MSHAASSSAGAPRVAFVAEADAREAFAALIARTQSSVGEGLAPWLARRVDAAGAVSAEVGLVAGQIRDLAMRGGKRMRAALVGAAYEAFGGEGGEARVAMPMMAMELLQVYLLVHDDWMDDDDVRRGGPAVHVVLRGRLGSRNVGDAAAVLAGDLASAYAQELLLAAPQAPERVLRAARTFAGIQRNVVMGQTSEIRATPEAWGNEERGAPASVETVHALKTASYTVTGPVHIGAILAGATDDATEALERFGRPLGIAFQLRDDLLGTFGDAAATGKPVGNDLRRGKRTALVEEMMRDAGGAALLDRVLGRPEAPTDALSDVLSAMEAGGARARVEERLHTLSVEARAALDDLRLKPSRGRSALYGAVTALTERSA